MERFYRQFRKINHCVRHFLMDIGVYLNWLRYLRPSLSIYFKKSYLTGHFIERAFTFILMVGNIILTWVSLFRVLRRIILPLHKSNMSFIVKWVSVNMWNLWNLSILMKFFPLKKLQEAPSNCVKYVRRMIRMWESSHVDICYVHRV